MDLRVERTLNALKEALTELLQEKSFDKLTVNDICEKANIRRTTFYLHYADKYDFMKSLMEEWFFDTIRQDGEAHEKTFDDYFLSVLKSSLSSVEEKRGKAQLVAKGNSYYLLDEMLKNSVISLLKADLKKRFPELKENELDLAATAYAGVYSAILHYFVTHEEETSSSTEALINRFLADYREIRLKEDDC